MALDLHAEDARSRKRALDFGSFIVEAPAGAGKTELLTQRYLKLLSQVNEPEEIIALTFTNKAATEMRHRVLVNLSHAAAGTPPDQPHEAVTRALAEKALRHGQARGWPLLEQPGRLRIVTLDALCSLLARHMPLMSRFGGQPEVLEKAQEHYREAARRTLFGLEDEKGSGPLTLALTCFDNDLGGLASQLARMLGSRDQWLEHVGRGTVPALAADTLTCMVIQDIAAAAAVLTPALQQQIMPAVRYAAAQLPHAHEISRLKDWGHPLRADIADLPLWRALCQMLQTEGGTWRKALNVRTGFPATEEGRRHKQALLECLASLPDATSVANLLNLPEAAADSGDWRMVGVLTEVLKLAVAHLMGVFRETNQVDFVEVARRARAALQDEIGPTELALRLDYSIQHLLVDEFQDTSPTQVDLLRRLTCGWTPGDGRTLFCVGDPMQSVYRFRKADVGLFLQVAAYGIGDVRLERLHLTHNNRSDPGVVDWVNQTFARVFSEADDAPSGAIRYRPCVATRPSAPGAGVFPHLLCQGEVSADLDRAEALEIVRIIRDTWREAPQRSIAVLVRARTHLQALVVELRRNHRDLPFQAVEVEALTRRQAVQDALSLTCALLHRADRVHWLAILRAPWCGLKLADLHRLAADDHRATIWQLMQDEARIAPMEGRSRLLHVREVLRAALAQQGRQPLRRWLETTWIRLGAPQCLWDPADLRDVAAFFDLVERLDGAGTLNLDTLEEAMDELYAAPGAGGTAEGGTLQFMTIHKSKGLQFDTVILPGLHRFPPDDDAPLVLWEEVAIADRPSQLVAALRTPGYKRNDRPRVYDYLRKMESRRAGHEATRLLYVAATRTERCLHLLAALTPTARGERNPSSGSPLKLLWPVLQTAFEASASVPVPGETGEDMRAFVPRLVRLPESRIPAPLVVRVEASESRLATSPPRDRLDAHCGTLAHRYMELIAQDGPAAWDVARLNTLAPAMQRWLTQQGHAVDAAHAGGQRVAQALETTLGSKDGQWVLQPHPQAAAEYARATGAEGTLATHVIDRTFVAQGTRWVIDYKLTHCADDPAARHAEAERHRPQLERYRALFVQEGFPVRMAVLLLAHGTLVELAD